MHQLTVRWSDAEMQVITATIKKHREPGDQLPGDH